MQVPKQVKTYKALGMFVIFIGALGLIEINVQFITWLNTLDPIWILLLWYVIFGGLIYGLGYFLFKKQTKHKRVLALVILFFASDILWYFPASNFVNQVTNTQSSPILLASEDGIVYELYQKIGFGEMASAWLTYIITPIILIVISFYLLGPKKFEEALRKLIAS